MVSADRHVLNINARGIVDFERGRRSCSTSEAHSTRRCGAAMQFRRKRLRGQLFRYQLKGRAEQLPGNLSSYLLKDLSEPSAQALVVMATAVSR